MNVITLVAVKTMTIPKKIKVGGHEYSVNVIPTWDTFEDGDYGETNPRTGMIYIDSDLIQTEQESAFFHEIFHIINKTLNHELLDSLSEQLYQVLADNKLLK